MDSKSRKYLAGLRRVYLVRLQDLNGAYQVLRMNYLETSNIRLRPCLLESQVMLLKSLGNRISPKSHH